jgi:hypothetical protein
MLLMSISAAAAAARGLREVAPENCADLVHDVDDLRREIEQLRSENARLLEAGAGDRVVGRKLLFGFHTQDEDCCPCDAPTAAPSEGATIMGYDDDESDEDDDESDEDDDDYYLDDVSNDDWGQRTPSPHYDDYEDDDYGDDGAVKCDGADSFCDCEGDCEDDEGSAWCQCEEAQACCARR